MKPKRTAVFAGADVTLVGPQLSAGDKAPQFTLLSTSLEKRTLNDFSGMIKLISVVPSLDTGICDQQTRRFSEEAKHLDSSAVILTVSMDLPFAQARWCGAAGVDNIVTLSDHLEADFGTQYGVLIEQYRLLNRSIFILDNTDTVRYVQIVEDNGEPDYGEALKALEKVIAG
jgi:thioredoxin-dependent peroxiredoxin